MRIGSLFAGIGGLELGLEWAGVGHTVWQVERDKYCTQVLAKHWPDAARYDDVRTVGSHNLEPVDVICGGFPCQDISYAGKGAGLAGERSGLWFEFARIVGEMGPRYVVVENVAALLTRGLDAVLGTLADLGYDAEWSTLRASDVGAPHRRERVFLVAYRASHGWRGERIAGDMADSSGEEGGAGDQSALSADDCGGRVHQLADTAQLLRDGSGIHGGGYLQAGDAIPEPGDRGSWMGHANRGRREQRDAGERSDAVVGAGHEPVGHAARDGRGAGAGESVRRTRGGCDGVDDADYQGLERSLFRGVAGTEISRPAAGPSEGLEHATGQRRDEREPVTASGQGPTSGGCAALGDAMHATGARLGYERRNGTQQPGGRRETGAPVGRDANRWSCGWSDATPVRGADGTVRLIPAEAAAQGPESPLWPVADGVPGRVARLRAIGNAVVPACAYVVGRRLLAIDAALRQESAA